MKRIIFLFTAVIGLSTLQSCEVTEVTEVIDSNQVFEAEVFELTRNLDNNFSLTGYFSRDIYASDHVLIYRLYGQQNGNDVWRLIPQTVYLNNNENFDYNYDFTKKDFLIFMDGNFDLNLLTNQERAAYVNNQTFRIVVIPGRFLSKMDYSDYDATIKSLGLENAKINEL